MLSLIETHAKQYGGQYTLYKKSACVTEMMVASSLRRMQTQGLLSFEWDDTALHLRCSRAALTKMEKWLRELSKSVHEELRRMEEVRVEKARQLVDMFRRADDILSDEEQSSFLQGQGCSTTWY